MKNYYKTVKAIKIYVTTLFVLVLFLPLNSWALTIEKAKIDGNATKIKGSGADPYAVILWQEKEVTQANKSGKFEFTSDILPLPPVCIGILQAGLEEFTVKVDNCRGKIDEFYSPSSVKQRVDPGEQGILGAYCDLGDYAVSGQYFLVSFGGSPGRQPLPINFRISQYGKTISGATGQQSWVIRGFNAGSEAIELRFTVQCARVLPPK